MILTIRSARCPPRRSWRRSVVADGPTRHRARAGDVDSWPMALPIGTRVGPYEVIAALGSGGMGHVYRARDTRLNRTVAIKVLPDHLAIDPAARARFVREGQALASFSHPNLVALYDVGVEGGLSFAVMELVDGETLQRKLVAGPL